MLAPCNRTSFNLIRFKLIPSVYSYNQKRQSSRLGATTCYTFLLSIVFLSGPGNPRSRCGLGSFGFGIGHLGINFIAPVMEHLLKLLDDLWLGPRKVVAFTDVIFQVEELNGSIFVVFEQLVSSGTNCTTRTLETMIAIVGKVPVDRSMLIAKSKKN